MRIDTAHIARMADVIRDMVGDDDAQAFIDTLEGETDVMEVLGYLVTERQQAQEFSEANKRLAQTYVDRARRLNARADAMARLAGDVLDATGERKIAHPLATISRTKGRTSVQITDPDAVPSQLCKVVKTPDKAAIKAQLDAGEAVPGAELTTAPDGVTIRIK